MPLQYPPARQGDVIDDHHGEAVADPYRWLEDPDSPEVAAWVAAQNALANHVLARSTDREKVRARVHDLWDYPRSGVPFERGGRWFQARNSGLQNHAVLYVAQTVSDEGRVLIDPNALSADGTVALTHLSVSPDGSLAAYAVSESGSDWMAWRVRDVESGRDLPDVVRWSKFSRAAWRHDLSGFFYSGMDEPSPAGAYRDENRGLRLMFHRLGSDQADDRVVFSAPDQPDWLPNAEVSDDGRYLYITVDRGTGPENMLLVADLDDASLSRQDVASDFSCKALAVGNQGRRLLVLTDKGAERCRIVAAELGDISARWTDVVPESDDTLLEAQVCGRRLVCHYLRDAHSVLRVFETTGRPVREVPLAGLVSLVSDPLGNGSFEGRSSSDLLHFQVVSFIESGALWSHNVATGETALVRPSASKLAVEDFVTEQVFAESDDGTPVPMFLTRRGDARPTGEVPALLYGYGGFDIAITPSFSVTFAAWLDGGGLLAVANLRGGGEYGRAWHDAGRLANKQNVFDDFCACARWLAGSGWSRPGRIGIFGGSNGGLLVGACVTQRPELFGAAVADVGVFDMLRFHKFTIGWAWRSDFGDPEVLEQYRWLRSYSPLHNVRDGRCYPPTLIMTGDHDDRVVPGHSFKFAAALQAAQGCEAPVLLRVATSAGHGLGKPTTKLIEEAADRVTFLDLTLHSDAV
ncbi:MAG: prolyl oligopeptidase family serine peptidase [Acidimicrobiales bacterium]